MAGMLDKIFNLIETISSRADVIENNAAINNVISFYGVKAGMGVSTLVSNLALTLSSQGKNVIVLDFDLHYPTQFRFLTKTSSLKETNIVDVKEFFQDSSMKVAGVYNDTKVDNLKLISAKEDTRQDAFFSVEDTRVEDLINEAAAAADVVLIDLGGADVAYETTINAIKFSNHVFTVITPDADILFDTYKAFSFLKHWKYYSGQPYVIQNKVITDPIAPEKFPEFGMRWFANLPMDTDQMRLRYNYKLMMQSNIETLASGIFRDIIGALTNMVIKITEMRPGERIPGSQNGGVEASAGEDQVEYEDDLDDPLGELEIERSKNAEMLFSKTKESSKKVDIQEDTVDAFILGFDEATVMNSEKDLSKVDDTVPQRVPGGIVEKHTAPIQKAKAEAVAPKPKARVETTESRSRNSSSDKDVWKQREDIQKSKERLARMEERRASVNKLSDLYETSKELESQKPKDKGSSFEEALAYEAKNADILANMDAVDNTTREINRIKVSDRMVEEQKDKIERQTAILQEKEAVRDNIAAAANHTRQKIPVKKEGSLGVDLNDILNQFQQTKKAEPKREVPQIHQTMTELDLDEIFVDNV